MAIKSNVRPCLGFFNRLPDDDAKNRQLLSWLSDDDDRATLYELINEQLDGILAFPSRDATPRQPCEPSDAHPRLPPAVGHKTVYLVTGRERIAAALRDGGPNYSSRPYGELGGGNFMLALDPASTGSVAHGAQLKALCHAFRYDRLLIFKVSEFACQEAAVLSLRADKFDLAVFAEQAALRFCEHLFGYATSDHPLLVKALRLSYKALVYQVMGRHFVTDPTAIPAATETMGSLMRRTGELIDAYQAGDDDVLKGTKVAAGLAGLVPVLKKLGAYRDGLNGEQRAVIAVGAVAGTVGNVQAAVCIAVKALFADPKGLLKEARKLAAPKAVAEVVGAVDSVRDPDTREAEADRKQWYRLIGAALRKNPPIAFLPRVAIPALEGRAAYSEMLLALGGGTQSYDGDDADDPLIWGLPPPAGCAGEADGRHWCTGRDLAWPLIVEVVRHVMGLPGLAERLDLKDASVIGLEKRWGFACESYPLSYRRHRRVAQSSLNVAMRIKAPVKDNAERLRRVIQAGAPRIDAVLRESRHVHFAWFEFIERDTVLVLHTVYDGDFAAYVQHFALRVGDTFDALFECIEDAPPMPVADFPDDFVAHIQRHDRKPAMGYFFSAYPRSEAARIMRDEGARR
jgi:hypothetical protein